MLPIRHSQQRAAIQAELAARTDHPTAEMLYHKLKPDWPKLSLGTVYRNLSQLCEAGLVQKLPGADADHFDGNASEHLHLSCKRCDAMFDLALPAPVDMLQQLMQQAGEYFPGEVTNCQLQFGGVCPNCLKAEKASE